MSLQKVKETLTLKSHEARINEHRWEELKNSLTPFNYREKLRHWEWQVQYVQCVKRKLVFLSQNLRRAHKRENPYEITIDLDYLYDIGWKQNWKCALSGDDLEFERGGDWIDNTNPKSCTIDRIDSNLGYIPGNIQLLSWRINRLKRDYSQDELLSIVYAIHKTKLDNSPQLIV